MTIFFGARRLSLVLLAVSLFLFGLSGVGVAYAQNEPPPEGPPPLPVIVQGTAYVDGVLMQGEAELTARILDWESRPVTVIDGVFDLLIVGPPSGAYTNQPVTFHLLEMESRQRTRFTMLGAPLALVVRLDFSERAGTPTPQLTPTELPVTPPPLPEESIGDPGDNGDGFGWMGLWALGGGVVVLAGVIGYVVKRRGVR